MEVVTLEDLYPITGEKEHVLLCLTLYTPYEDSVAADQPLHLHHLIGELHSPLICKIGHQVKACVENLF